MQVKKILRYSFLILLSLMIIGLVGGYFVAKKYEKEITASVVNELNKQIDTKVDVKDINFSIFKSFPKASLQFDDVFIRSTEEFFTANPDKDTLLWARKMSLDFNLIDIFYGKYVLTQMRLKDAVVKMQIDRKERDNFHIFKENNDSSTTAFSIDLKKVILNNVAYQFNNFAVVNHIELYANQFIKFIKNRSEYKTYF